MLGGCGECMCGKGVYVCEEGVYVCKEGVYVCGEGMYVWGGYGEDVCMCEDSTCVRSVVRV